MKKLFVLFFLGLSLSLFADNIPNIYFPLGIEETEFLYKIGNDIIQEDKNIITQKTYNYKKTYETITYIFNESNRLGVILVDICPDYGSARLSYKEFVQQVFKAYREELFSILGKPYSETSNGYVWKFDDAFCVFYPETVDTFIRFRFNIFNKEYAKDTEYEVLYQ